MKWHKLSLRVGILAVLAAMLLRFAGSGLFGEAVGIFSQPELASFLIYSETGRTPAVPETTTPTPAESTSATEQTQPPQTEPTVAPTTPTTSTTPSVPGQRPTFTAADVEYVKLINTVARNPDLKALLVQKLKWDLTGDKPTVLIIHSHGTEAYTKTADSMYENYAAYRTMDERYNMISLGDELARLLEQQGITVLHDRTAHDYLDYDNSYKNARKSIEEYLKEYPSIKLVLDLHRDAATNADGSQWATSATVDGKPSAQMMLVVGSDAAGEKNPDWQDNLSFAEKLAVLLQKDEPGICRGVRLKSKSYNQDLATASLIVEIGSAGNTHAEAMNCVPVLAEAIAALAKGTA
ncbi:MAG: stage II sporulation protein P [Oscillospiraceae bacterium]|nr:stage II sporulation protein P [Oscillospiraceae bacterium]